MQQHINFITLGVADLAASRRFYREVFGWRESADSNEHIAFFQAGSALVFALFGRDALADDAQQPPAHSGGFPRFTLAHNVGSEAEVARGSRSPLRSEREPTRPSSVRRYGTRVRARWDQGPSTSSASTEANAEPRHSPHYWPDRPRVGGVGLHR